MNEEKKLYGMEGSKSERNAHCMFGHDRRTQFKLESRCGVQIMTTRTGLDYAHMGSLVYQFTC